MIVMAMCWWQCPARVGFGQSRSESEEKTPFTLVEKCKLKKSFQATNMVMITFSLVLRKRVGRPSRVRWSQSRSWDGAERGETPAKKKVSEATGMSRGLLEEVIPPFYGVWGSRSFTKFAPLFYLFKLVSLKTKGIISINASDSKSHNNTC